VCGHGSNRLCPSSHRRSQRLLAIVADRNHPFKHVQRAHIVLCSADRLPVQEVARRAGASRPSIWRWQARYAEQGVDGLLRDKTRKPGRARLSARVVAKVMDLTCSEPPGHATHWTGRAMAKAVGVSLRAVQRLWEAHRLQPHRIRTFKRSNDPEFAEKVEDIVGLYMDPPKHAVVVSIDETSQIQALDRTQPGLPLKPGKCGTMTMTTSAMARPRCSPRSHNSDCRPFAWPTSAKAIFEKLAQIPVTSV
jgi:transposase